MAIVCAAAASTRSGALSLPGVVVHRLPAGGIQPQVATDERAVIHLIYFRGDPSHGDAFYARSQDDGRSFSAPIRVNSVAGSVMATGTVRGAQIAVGRGGRVHVAWNSSTPTSPGATPMYYTRLTDTGTAFEPQRNVMRDGYNIDGGGAVAADRLGHVYVVWHANAPGERDEGTRRLWIARSQDDGRTFEHERPIFDDPTGACGCCGIGAIAASTGSLFVLFRSAFEIVHRDMYLLTSRDNGGSFAGRKVDLWNVGACVMSTQTFSEGRAGVYTAWETEGQVYLARVDAATGGVAQKTPAPGADRTRKHPAVAINGNGDVLLAWTESTGWNRGGLAAWQVFNAAGTRVGDPGHADGVPVWGLVAAYPRRDGGFTIAF
jgi:hypothetical protein